MKLFENVCRVKIEIKYTIEDVIGELLETVLPICLSFSASSQREKTEFERNSS